MSPHRPRLLALPLWCALGAAGLASPAAPALPGPRPALLLANAVLPPMTYLKAGKPSGVVVDLARAMARHMHRPVDLQLMDWAQAQRRVQAGQADALLQINPSPERLEQFDFSLPLLTSEFCVFTTADHPGIKSMEDLDGLKVGVEAQGLPILLLGQDPRIHMQVVPDFHQGFRSLADGALDAVVADRWVGTFILAEDRIRGVSLVNEPIGRSRSAIAVKKGNAALLADIDQALAAIRRDGTYDRILQAWRPEEVVFETREQVQARAWMVTAAIAATLLSLAGVVALVLVNSRRRRAEQALLDTDRRRVEFLAMLSHELRNPLAPIRYSLSILDHVPPGDARAAQAKAVLDRQTQQLSQLVDDLLDVTRITRDKIQLQRERVDLAESAARTVADLGPVFQRSGVRVETFLPQMPVWVEGDRTRLAQILGNLLQNAAKFTPAGGKATLTLMADPVRQQAILTVADDGCGIEPRLVPELFEPFAQAERTLDRSKGGLGLGLALVKGLVERHGGSVQGESAGPGKGARFTVRLPLLHDIGPGRLQEPPPVPRPGSRRVLVIEDMDDSARSLQQMLKLRGHTVETAQDGPEGLRKVQGFRPDVVLCDIGLPGMDGFQVAQALRQDPGSAGIQLVALSGYTQPEDRDKAMQAGFQAHLAKPLDLDALERVLAGLPE